MAAGGVGRLKPLPRKEGKDDGVATPIPKPPVQVERLLTEVKSQDPIFSH